MSGTPIGGVPVIPSAESATSAQPITTPLIPHQPGAPDHDRIIALESAVNAMAAAFGARLQAGAATMGELRNSIAAVATMVKGEVDRLEALLAPKPERKATPIELIGAVVLVIGFVGGLIWWASRYPERGEFERIVNDVSGLKTRLDVDAAVREQRRVVVEERLKALEGRHP